MAKKNKHERRNKKAEISKWEELIPIKEETVKSLYENSQMMKELISNLKITITENPEVTKVINGGMINFNHLAKAVNTNAMAHYETKKITKEDGTEEEVIDNEKPRKGVVTDDDYMKYFQIYNNYVNAQSHAVNLLSKYSMEIMSLLQEKKIKGIDLPKEDINKIMLNAEATNQLTDMLVSITDDPIEKIKEVDESIIKKEETEQPINVMSDKETKIEGNDNGKSK